MAPSVNARTDWRPGAKPLLAGTLRRGDEGSFRTIPPARMRRVRRL